MIFLRHILIELFDWLKHATVISSNALMPLLKNAMPDSLARLSTLCWISFITQLPQVEKTTAWKASKMSAQGNAQGTQRQIKYALKGQNVSNSPSPSDTFRDGRDRTSKSLGCELMVFPIFYCIFAFATLPGERAVNSVSPLAFTSTLEVDKYWNGIWTNNRILSYIGLLTGVHQ